MASLGVLKQPVEIVATDLSRSMLDICKSAEYDQLSLGRGLSPERLQRFFEKISGNRAGDRYRVRAEIRAISAFRRGNLASHADAGDPAPGSVSVVVCRNMLLYFSEEAVELAAARFARAAAPGGFLVTAAADPPITEHMGWTRVPGVVGVYRQSEATPHDGPARHAKASSSAWIDGLASTSPSSTSSPVPTLDAASPPVAPAPVIFETVSAGSSGAAEPELDAAHHHEHALTLLEAGDIDGALAAARRVTYLEPQLAMGHFTLALVALRLGRLEIARRSYREASRLALVSDPDAELPLGDGLRAAEIARSSARQLERPEAGR